MRGCCRITLHVSSLCSFADCPKTLSGPPLTSMGRLPVGVWTTNALRAIDRQHLTLCFSCLTCSPPAWWRKRIFHTHVFRRADADDPSSCDNSKVFTSDPDTPGTMLSTMHSQIKYLKSAIDNLVTSGDSPKKSLDLSDQGQATLAESQEQVGACYTLPRQNRPLLPGNILLETWRAVIGWYARHCCVIWSYCCLFCSGSSSGGRSFAIAFAAQLEARTNRHFADRAQS